MNTAPISTFAENNCPVRRSAPSPNPIPSDVTALITAMSTATLALPNAVLYPVILFNVIYIIRYNINLTTGVMIMSYLLQNSFTD